MCQICLTGSLFAVFSGCFVFYVHYTVRGQCGRQGSNVVGGNVIQHSHTRQLEHLVWWSYYVFCGISHRCAVGFYTMIGHSYWTSACRSIMMLRMRQNRHLPGKGCAGHYERLCVSLESSVTSTVDEYLIHRMCRFCKLSTARSLIMAPVQRYNMVCCP